MAASAIQVDTERDNINLMLQEYSAKKAAGTVTAADQFDYRVVRLRPLVKKYYSVLTRATFGSEYRGMYLLSSYDPTSFHFDFAAPESIFPQGHWDYVDSDFSRGEKINLAEQDRIKEFIINPELVGTTSFWHADPAAAIMKGFTTAGNRSTRLVGWRVGLNPPKEIALGSYDVVYYNQDVAIHGREELHWNGIITQGLAAALLRPGGFVYAHSNNIEREHHIAGCQPILSNTILDHCLWKKE